MMRTSDAITKVAAAVLGIAGCVGVVGPTDRQGSTSDVVGTPGGPGPGTAVGTGTSGGAGSGGPGTSSGVGSSGSAGTSGAVVAFAPSLGAYKRLTASSFRNSLNDLIGPVTVGALEPDSWDTGGLATVGMAQVSISALGVEEYQTAIDAATTQAFADTVRRDKLLGCTPKSAQDTACFQTFVTQFGRLAFRQALTKTQIDRYVQLTSTVATTLGDVYEGMRASMSGILQSPSLSLSTRTRSGPDQRRHILAVHQQ